MPIANCIITSDYSKCINSSNDLITLWASESDMSPDNMTINIIKSDEQHGKKYTVMADLLLPSVWSGEDVSKLQIGLAKALALYFNVSKQQVFVVTNIVNSGMVVEEGEEVIW